MKVFSDVTDTVVARDLDDVKNVIDETYGDHHFELNEMSLDDWTEAKPGASITICNIDDAGPENKLTLTVEQWIEREGRGLLCSTEW